MSPRRWVIAGLFAWIAGCSGGSEVEEKVLEWLEAGALMVVVVNPRKRAVTVYRSLTDIIVLTEDDTLSGGDVVPGWTVAVKDIFA